MESMDKYDKWNYWLNYGISIDKVGNTISQGSHHNTISARVGGCANTEGGHKKYWGFLEKVINWTFLPVDGPNHCYRAYLKEKDSTTFREGNKWGRAALVPILLIVCPIIGIVLRVLKVILKVIKGVSKFFKAINFS